MKNILLCFVVLTFFSSCEPISNRDMSLAGSIASNHMAVVASGKYGDTVLKDLLYTPTYLSSYFDIEKVSDTEVSIDCVTTWIETETVFKIFIPIISVGGEPDNVTFDFTSTESTVIHDDNEYFPVSTSVKGWIRNTRFEPYVTRYSPVEQEYIFEVELNCNIENKLLSIVIGSKNT